MTDDELITAVRQPFTTVRMNTPVDQIVSRGRAVRARHRIPWMAGTLAVAAGLAVALTALLPASHQPRTQLTAWTVAEQAGGNIRVTIRELRDPAGLQRKLRADGVSASVTFFGQDNPACDRRAGTAGQTRRPGTCGRRKPAQRHLGDRPDRRVDPDRGRAIPRLSGRVSQGRSS